MLLPYGFEEPVRKHPRATYALIGLNTLLFLLIFFMGAEKRDFVFMQWGFIPDELSMLYPLLTSMFLHGGWLHLIGNMYFLWIFGGALEDKLGGGKYIAFYLAAGIAGNLAHSLTTPQFFSDIPCIGASGAISGILGAFMITAPYAKIKTAYFFVPVLRPLMGTIQLPALLFVGSWFLMQLLYALSVSSVVAVGVAYWAHIGGFLLGMLAVGGPKIYRRTRRCVIQWTHRREFLHALELAQERDWTGAGEMLEYLEATSPETPDIDILLSQAYFQAGSGEEARTMARTALKNGIREKNPAQTITAYYILQNIGNAEELETRDYLILGRAFAGYEKMEQAGGLLAEALRKFPEDSEIDLILYELGDIYVRVRDYKRAREAYTLLVESRPDSKLYESAQYCLRELQCP
jgi:membrane associated rhomboid family serine protease/Flp pilus assembly protein TadD